MTESRYDALVIGGGPGGATAALLLARAGWSVALMEERAFPRRKVCGEYLSATSFPLLRHLGVGDAFHSAAGPEVGRVGLFAGATIVDAALPLPREHGAAWGRALAREHLDTILLTKAAEAGVEVFQPWSAKTLTEVSDGYFCRAESHGKAGRIDVYARIVIAAHGSWTTGALPTQPKKQPARPSDLLAFKAHFRDSALTPGLMPLWVFPGGYGGIVHCDDGRVSVSCCIRRDRLADLRRGCGLDAGDAVLAYLMEECLGVRRALAGARREETWLAAGPIRPGIRLRSQRGLFAVGNAAGEAHPVVAEGISMAMQSAWLLAERLIAWRRQGGASAFLADVGDDYVRAWRRAFVPRLRAASVIAHWGMRPVTVAGLLPLLRRWPALLTLWARLSGKATQIVPSCA